MAVATGGAGRGGRGRGARSIGRRKWTEGVWWTAVCHFVWLESVERLGRGSILLEACDIAGFLDGDGRCRAWRTRAARAVDRAAEMDRGGVVDCRLPLCLVGIGGVVGPWECVGGVWYCRFFGRRREVPGEAGEGGARVVDRAEEMDRGGVVDCRLPLCLVGIGGVVGPWECIEGVLSLASPIVFVLSHPQPACV